jgi:hypothetical protein
MSMASSPNRATARGQAPIASARDQVRRCPGRDCPAAKRRFRPDVASTRVGSDLTTCTPPLMPRSDDGKPRGDGDQADPGLRRNGIRVRQPSRWSGARCAFRGAAEPDECYAARSWRR